LAVHALLSKEVVASPCQVTTGFLKFLRFAIGPDSLIEDAAIVRLHLAGVMVNGAGAD
jgi:hypothetical protein